MTSPSEPTNGSVTASGVDYAQAAFQRVLDQLRDQQGLIERQQAEIEELRRDKADLRAELSRILDHFGYGPESVKSLTPEDIKEMDEHGIPGEEFLAEVERLFGK